jgi:hypothetical protein
VFYPITDDDVPGIVTLMNRAYRGAGAAGCAQTCSRSLTPRS